MNKFEELWLMEERDPGQRSLAERASLISRALHGLAPTDHEGWGLRAAQCLAEAADGAPDPYAPASRQQDLDGGHRAAAARHKSCASLFEDLSRTLVATGSVAAIVDAFCSLASMRIQESKEPWERAPTSSQALFHAALGKICSEGNWTALELMLSHGPTIYIDQLDKLRAHDGQAMDSPSIALAVTKTIENHWKRIFASTDPKGRGVSPFAFEDLTCGRASWVDTLIAPIVAGETFWGSVQALAAMARQAEAIRTSFERQANERLLVATQGSVADSARASNGKARSFSAGQAAAAEQFWLEIFKAIDLPLGRLAIESPPHAARAIMTFCQASLGSSWTNAGLGTINAAKYIFFSDPYLLREYGDRANIQRELAKKTADDANHEMEGAEINLIDCALLHKAPRDQIMKLAHQGHAPSAELAKILRLPRIQNLYAEDYLLWMESFIANPDAGPRARQLRI